MQGEATGKYTQVCGLFLVTHCFYCSIFYASLRWESSPSFPTSTAVASRLAQTKCFCVLVAGCQSAVRGTLPGSLLRFQRKAESAVVPVRQQLNSSSRCTPNTSASPVLSAESKDQERIWADLVRKALLLSLTLAWPRKRESFLRICINGLWRFL